MTKKEMIKELVHDIDLFSHAELLEWSQRIYEEYLNLMSEETVKTIYDYPLSHAGCDCDICKEIGAKLGEDCSSDCDNCSCDTKSKKNLN